MPSHTSPMREKTYLGYDYAIEKAGIGVAVWAWPTTAGERSRREELATAHYFERSTDAARWLQAAIRRLAKKRGE